MKKSDLINLCARQRSKKSTGQCEIPLKRDREFSNLETNKKVAQWYSKLYSKFFHCLFHFVTLSVNSAPNLWTVNRQINVPFNVFISSFVVQHNAFLIQLSFALLACNLFRTGNGFILGWIPIITPRSAMPLTPSARSWRSALSPPVLNCRNFFFRIRGIHERLIV